ncbi:MAG: VIT1/CCC1 transporter family protein [Candidatus Daviesbacteria bacterium]|nr:VIT1/CCC1 transporter family protein [Candidatus Daviesbacteria bacterium]
MKIKLDEDYFRSVMFGLQDGLVSTTGVVVGISAGVSNPAIIILASFVAISVEASSMAAGEYSSEKAVHQIDKKHRHKDDLIIGALLMFISYFLAGLVPVLPFLIFPVDTARIVSIAAALFSLFIIGYFKGKIVKEGAFRSAAEMLIIGGLATAVGLIVGNFLKV